MSDNEMIHPESNLPKFIQETVEDATVQLLARQEMFLEQIVKDVGIPAEQFFKDHIVEFEPIEMNILDAPDRLNVVYLGATQKMRVRRKTREERLADESRTNEGVPD